MEQQHDDVITGDHNECGWFRTRSRVCLLIFLFVLVLALTATGVAIGIGWNGKISSPAEQDHIAVEKEPSSAPTPTPTHLDSWEQLGQDLYGEAEGDRFGRSVDLSSDGTTVAVGAPEAYYGTSVGPGYVRVFRYDTATKQWNQMGQDIRGEADGDQFGISVALSSDGSVLAVGADRNDGNGSESGHSRVFLYNAVTGQWNQLGQDIDGEAAADQSGESIALSSDGSILAVSAGLNDGNGNSAGHVRVFQYKSIQSNYWLQLGQDIDGEAAVDLFGVSVSLSSDGTILAAGADWNDGNGNKSGHVRVFQYNGVTMQWKQLGQDIDGEAADDRFGISVALSSDGMIVAAGAYRNEGNGYQSGHVRVFRYHDTTKQWNQLGQDIEGEAVDDQFGESVALSANGAIVASGARYNDGNGGSSGHVRAFQYSDMTSQWVQLGQDLDGKSPFDELGISVALSADGKIVAAGSEFSYGTAGDMSGNVLVFEGK